MPPSQKTRRPLIALLLLVILGAACGGPSGQPLAPTATEPFDPGTPAPARSPNELVQATPGSDWATRTDDALGATFSYPPGWQIGPDGRLEGPDGYAWLETRPSEGAGPGAVCQGEANRGKPERYGAYPLIVDLVAPAGPGCVVLPSEDQPADRQGEGLAFFWYPPADRPDTLLVLHASREHLYAIAQSMRVANYGTKTANEPTCNFNITDVERNTHNLPGVVIDEYPVARAAGCGPTLEPVEFERRVAEGKAGARVADVLEHQWSPERLRALNARLAPFRYKVEAYDSLYRIMRRNEVVRDNFSWLGQLTVSSSGDDFIFPLVDSYNATSYLLRPDGVHASEAADLLLFDRVFPVFVGDEIIRLAYEYERYPRPLNEPALLNVLKDDRVIDTFSVSGSNPASGPVRGLWAWDGHWVLELPGLVIQDGQILNDALGYAEMFSWRLLLDRPFYFFRQDGVIQASFDGQVLPVTYDEVLSEPQWTRAMLVQMRTYDNGLVFYARRGEVWYYVVVEAVGE